MFRDGYLKIMYFLQLMIKQKQKNKIKKIKRNKKI